MKEFDENAREEILAMLEEKQWIFPQFALARSSAGFLRLGEGGFSSVYEMINKDRHELKYALKVIGFDRHIISSGEFWDTGRIQWLLCQESEYIVRLIDMAEIVIEFNDDQSIKEVKDASKDNTEVWETDENNLRLQFVLMEKLDQLLFKDRFKNVTITRQELTSETEVIKFALEIGRALDITHGYNVLHRDIKLENIFWDNSEHIYKLGDFGIAKYAEDGNAETVVYTDGYGAPEIERRLYDYYNTTADIYSFGITLYLLLNDMRFPGSEGYCPKVEVQYNPDNTFPAPAHASPEMTRVIRKMCSYYSEDRYQNIPDVLDDLAYISKKENMCIPDNLTNLTDMVTETYMTEDSKSENVESDIDHQKTRSERRIEQINAEKGYRKKNIKYLVIMTALMVMLLQSLQSNRDMMNNWILLGLAGMVLIEAVLQKIGDFHIFVGIILEGIIGLSILNMGLSASHIMLSLAILIGSPIITASSALAVGTWSIISTEGYGFLHFVSIYSLGWVIFLILILTLYRYFIMQNMFGKVSYIRALVTSFIFDKISIVMIIVGIVLFGLQKGGIIRIPYGLQTLHIARVGIISLIVLVICMWIEQIPVDTDKELDTEEMGDDK